MPLILFLRGFIFKIMRRLSFIFAIIFLSNFNIVLSQEHNKKGYKFEYTLTFVEDSSNIDLKKQEKFYLFTNSNKSRFISANTILIDSLKEKAKKDRQFALSLLGDLSKIPKSNFSFEIYKKINFDTIVTIDKILNDKFIFSEKINNNWSILSDTLTINGYHCKKAIQKFKGREYTAWFTTKIPISDGPYKFKGLPGLIIKMYDKRNHYSFQLSGFEYYDNQILIPNIYNKSLIKTTSREFKKTQLNSSKIYFQRLEQSGITLNNTGKKKLGNKILRKITNPIELKEDDE